MDAQEIPIHNINSLYFHFRQCGENKKIHVGSFFKARNPKKFIVIKYRLSK